MVDVAEGEQPPEELHTLAVRSTRAGYHAVCRCGLWEGWWHTIHTQAWVLDDFDHHRRASSNGGNTPPVQ